jgi:hypothetical protein
MDTRSHGCQFCNEVFSYAHDRSVHEETCPTRPRANSGIGDVFWAVGYPNQTDEIMAIYGISKDRAKVESALESLAPPPGRPGILLVKIEVVSEHHYKSKG